MENQGSERDFFGTERIGRILWRIAPPVMLAQLIQSLYNIVDSLFVGRYSADALTAVTVIYPLQLVIIALAVGTGAGVNTYMARKYAQGADEQAGGAAGTGMVLAVLSWAALALLTTPFMRAYVATSASEAAAIDQAVRYGHIVCIGSLFTFLEGNWSKVHQARGNMRRPMIAQIAGALTNVILDPLLIFGVGPFPEMGVAGAALATVIGQFVAAVLTGIGGACRPPHPVEMRHYAGRIYHYGYPSILMQLLYTVYIVGLNVVLAGFSDAAVTVLGLYYKWQSFFFIPLIGLQTCIVPVLSYNYARGNYPPLPRDHARFAAHLARLHVGGLCLFRGVPGGADSRFFRFGTGDRHRHGRLPHHRVQLLRLGVLADAAGVFPSDRQRRDQPHAVADPPNFCAAAGLLAVFQDRAELHVACLSRGGICLRHDRPPALSPPTEPLGRAHTQTRLTAPLLRQKTIPTAVRPSGSF